MTAELEKKKTSAETDSESGEKLYTGRIVKSTGGLYRVEIGGEGADKTGETVDCRAKGAFRRDKLIPLTGDKVRLRVTRTGEGFITEILTRKNSLIRPAVANVDTLVLVIASAHPDPDLYILDKLTAIAAFNGIDTVLVINKCDLKNADELQKLYHTARIPGVLPFGKRAGSLPCGLRADTHAYARQNLLFFGCVGRGQIQPAKRALSVAFKA